MRRRCKRPNKFNNLHKIFHILSSSYERKNIYCYVNVNVYVYEVLSVQTIEDSTKNIHIVMNILKKLIKSKIIIHLFN